MDAATPMKATKKISAWLSAFGEALERQDIETAVGMFAPECYWRDLVSFTWNIVTFEGRDAVGAISFNIREGVGRGPMPSAINRFGSHEVKRKKRSVSSKRISRPVGLLRRFSGS